MLEVRPEIVFLIIVGNLNYNIAINKTARICGMFKTHKKRSEVSSGPQKLKIFRGRWRSIRGR
jgi:hypothetical protein